MAPLAASRLQISAILPESVLLQEDGLVRTTFLDKAERGVSRRICAPALQSTWALKRGPTCLVSNLGTVDYHSIFFGMASLRPEAENEID